MCSLVARISAFVLVLALLAGTAFCGSAQKLMDRAMKYWERRDEMKSLTKAIALFELVLKSNPNPELERKTRLLLSRAYYWYGNSLDPRQRKARIEAYTKGMDVLKPLLDADPKDHEANFWYTVNLSSRGREVGVLKSAFLLPEVLERMKIVEQKDKWYFYGGPNRLYARMIQKSPSFIRKAKGYDLSDAERLLKANIERFPFMFMNRLFLAEIYVEEGRIGDACRELNIIVQSDPGDNPDYAANNRRDKKRARKLLQELRSKYPLECGEPARAERSAESSGQAGR